MAEACTENHSVIICVLIWYEKVSVEEEWLPLTETFAESIFVLMIRSLLLYKVFYWITSYIGVAVE